MNETLTPARTRANLEARSTRRDLLGELAAAHALYADTEYVQAHIRSARGATRQEIDAAARAAVAAGRRFDALLAAYCLETASTYDQAMQAVQQEVA